MSTDDSTPRNADADAPIPMDSAPSDSAPADAAPHAMQAGPVRRPTMSSRRKTVLISTAVVGAVAIGVGGPGLTAIALVKAVRSAVTSDSLQATGALDTTDGGSTYVLPSFPDADGLPDFDRGDSFGRGSSSTQTEATAATADEQVGVVTIVSSLDYSDSSEAAGTGMVISSDGLILTNNHVIDGSTSIAVTVESTGETFAAEVVGYDATADVAVLQLVDGSGDRVTGLDAVSFDDDEATAVGDAIYSVGNAEGTGDLVTAAGTVTAIGQDLTVGSEYSSTTESLSNLIVVDSDVVSGDSGGPLFDDDGEVIGIITAASSGTSNITGYAIDIDDALDIVTQIASGIETDTVSIGLPAFLGVQLGQQQTGAGVVVGGVIAELPAALAGLTAGDTITSVDGAAITTTESLTTAIAAHDPGDQIVVGYTDASGVAQSVTVTLTAGPAA